MNFNADDNIAEGGGGEGAKLRPGTRVNGRETVTRRGVWTARYPARGTLEFRDEITPGVI